MLAIFVLVVLIVFLLDFSKIRKQNQTMIEQNDKIISLIEEIKSKQRPPETEINGFKLPSR